MSKFKAGDKVYSIFEGVVTLEKISDRLPGFEALTTPRFEVLPDGRLSDGDTNPMLYTLEEARRMGFPVPAEPVVFETTIAPRVGGFGELRLTVPELEHLLGKRVRVTVEVAE